MGILMSLMGKGLPPTQMLSFVMGTLYNQFIQREINNFGDFHIAILDIFNTVNSALPGKHFDVPPLEEVKACFTSWTNAKDRSDKRQVFVEFMKEKVTSSKVDDSMIITGIVTPPAAMVVKRAGENVPQLNMIKVIPDIVFVPSATVLALISVKVSRRIFMGEIAS